MTDQSQPRYRAPDVATLIAGTKPYVPQKLNGAGADGLPLRFWCDLNTITPPDKLVRGLLGTASTALISGEPASGKTFLATDIGMHIAMGWAWFGRAVTQGAVIYVAGEGASGISNRLAAYRLRHDLPADVPFVVIPAAPNLGPSGQDAQRVVDAIGFVETRAGKAVQLVIIDTLARAMGSGDENSTQDMGQFIAACDRIRLATGASILIVHHRGKAQTGPRGSSALMGAVDTAIEVEKREGGRAAKVMKQKDGQDGQELGFDLVVVEVGLDDDDSPITTCIVQPSDEVAKAAPKLSPKHQRALGVLRNTLADHPEQRPNSVTVPSVTLTKVERFRKALESEGVTDRNGERAQWQRIKESLCNKGLLRIKDDLCWIP